MNKLMPLRRFVVEITSEASPDDPDGIRKAIKSWHNRLQIGSIPRSVIEKIGRGLFVNLEAWENWLASRRSSAQGPRKGRPRSGVFEPQHTRGRHERT
jgi:hypothetical protein